MTKREAETSGEKDAERLAVCVICVTYTVDRPVPRCETHNRHPTDCIRALQSELAAAKAKHDEELAARRRRSDLALGIVQKERDAALARVKELEYWRNGSWAMKALDKARDERDAALAQNKEWERSAEIFRAAVEVGGKAKDAPRHLFRLTEADLKQARASAEALRAAFRHEM